MRIIETDNRVGDYPNESFLNLPSLPPDACVRIAAAINDSFPLEHPRYYRVVDNDYELQPGCEP